MATHEVTPEETKAVEEKTNEKKLVKSITIGSPIKDVAAGRQKCRMKHLQNA